MTDDRLQRERFEKFYTEIFPDAQIISGYRRDDGSYYCDYGDAMWKAWQAALSAQTEARDDTARIDYLETLRGDMITGSSDDQELIGHDWVIYGQFYTVREALDYGMMKRQEAIAQGDL